MLNIKPYPQAVTDGDIKEHQPFSLADATKFNANQTFLYQSIENVNKNVIDVQDNLTTTKQQLELSDVTLAGEISILKNKVNAVDISPNQAGISTIGSPTEDFKSVHIQEIHIGSSKILSSVLDSITLSSSENQDINVSTTGTAKVSILSQSEASIKTNGMNADAVVQSQGTGSKSRIMSDTEIVLTSPLTRTDGDHIVSGNQTVNGNLNVLGTVTTIQTSDMAVTDNVITLNNGEVGSGVTANFAGIQIDRGLLNDVRFVYDESTGKWLMGVINSEVAVASETFVISGLSTKANAIHTHQISNIEGLQFELDSKLSTNGNAASASRLSSSRTIALSGDISGEVQFDGQSNVTINSTLPVTGVTAGTYKSVTVDTKGRVTAGSNPTTLSAYGITDAYTKNQVDTLISAIDSESINTTVQTASFTAVAKEEYIITADAITVTLPASPTTGTQVKLLDGTGSIAAITIAGNGQNVEGSASYTVNSPSFQLRAVYINATYGWRVFGF